MTKINIDTDGRLVWTRVHREFFRDKPGEFDFRPPGKTYMYEYAKFIAHKTGKLGSAGQLPEVRESWPPTLRAWWGFREPRSGGRCAGQVSGRYNDMQLGVLVFLGIVAFFLLVTSIRIAQEYQRGVVFRLGRYIGTRGPGLYLLIPFGVETQSLIDIRIKTVPIESQETITRDSVTIRVNAALWYKVIDPGEKSVINGERTCSPPFINSR